MEADHDDLRAAITWAVDSGDAPTALALTSGLWRFWQMRGYITEGLARTACRAGAAGLRRRGPAARRPGRGRWPGVLERRPGRALGRTTQEALDIRRRRGDPGAIAESLYNLSFTYAFRDDPAEGEAIVAEAIELFEQAGDKVGLARARWALANIEYVKGQGGADRARDLATLALATFEEVDNRFMIGWTTYTLGLSRSHVGTARRGE